MIDSMLSAYVFFFSVVMRFLKKQRCDLSFNRLRLVVKATASGAEDPGFESRLWQDVSGRVIPVTSKLALQWLPIRCLPL